MSSTSTSTSTSASTSTSVLPVESSSSSHGPMGRSRTRTTAKEAVSSQWASRAETSSRMKQTQQQQQKQQQNIVSTSPTNVNVNVNANTTTNSTTNTNNSICQTWRQIQKSLGWNLLLKLDHEQKKQGRNRRLERNKQMKNNHHGVENGNVQGQVQGRGQSQGQGQVNGKGNGRNKNKKGKAKSPPKSRNIDANYNTRPPKTSQKQNAEMLANTLTKMRVTNALQIQLKNITKNSNNSNNNSSNNNSSNSNSNSNSSTNYNYLKNVLSILPAGFDETSALVNSIQERKRAFMLMDLGRVISEHAKFLSYTCSFGEMDMNTDLPPTHRLRRMGAGVNSIGRKRRGVYIQPQFSVTKNPHIELLKLLVRLGVDLRCNSGDDVIAASQAIKEEKNERNEDYNGNDYSNDNSNANSNGSGNESDENLSSHQEYYGEEGMVLVDDVSKTRKPNGYFRRLLQTRRGRDQFEIAVDDVDEVIRISNATRRFSSQASCRFMLRLPANDFEVQNGQWENLIFSIFAAAKEEGGELFGVSVDLSSWSDELLLNTSDKDMEQGQEEVQASQIMLNKICTRLRLFRLLLLSVGQYHIRIDLTGLPSLTREHCQILTDALSNIVSCAVTIEELMQVHITTVDAQNEVLTEQWEEIRDAANDPKTCSLVYTADISTHLVARAGALCTRIIGVKSKDSMPTEKNENDIGIHYFIDDGCYGSLGSSCSRKHVPVPLYGNKMIPKSTSYLSLSQSHSKVSPVLNTSPSTNKSSHVLSTVWGPTCDGLDKVCKSVLLPKDLEANRDWLVFSHLGCGGFGGGLGLGTSFNGFDPPDLAYCVLGYFSGGAEL